MKKALERLYIHLKRVLHDKQEFFKFTEAFIIQEKSVHKYTENGSTVIESVKKPRRSLQKELSSGKMLKHFGFSEAFVSQ